jgi:hypothetical protein
MVIQRLRTCGDENLSYCAVEFSLDSASALMPLRCFPSLGNNLELDTALAFPQRDRGHAFHLRGGHKPTTVQEGRQVLAEFVFGLGRAVNTNMSWNCRFLRHERGTGT